jgi:phage gp36-like protein
MKMKKLSRNEVNVLAQVVSKKIVDAKTEASKKILAKDKSYLKWLKLNQEKDELQKKLNELYNEESQMIKEIRNKYKVTVTYSRDILSGEVKISIWDNNNNVRYSYDIANEIVLMGIGSELNVDELIEKLVDKYSK